ncbi:MAG: hypothetical protein D6723_09000 [Acidobacteria bacterium]|nr:MAG: hypothetical protein D6723_09000 [Acidobacteriota bacterium]
MPPLVASRSVTKKRTFAQPLGEAERDRVTILIFRRGELAGALLPPEEDKQLERLHGQGISDLMKPDKNRIDRPCS